MKKDYDALADAIIQKVGGQGNVSHLEHCSTRLRFTIRDDSKVDMDGLKKTPGVLGVVRAAGQTQVIIGNDVIEAYDAIAKKADFTTGGTVADDPKPAENKTSIGGKILDFMIGVFQPLVPAIAGAGILKAILSLFVLLGWMSSSGDVYFILMQAADAALYFLPLMVAVTMASKIGCNRVTAVAIVGVTLLPKITAALADGQTFFGIGLQNIAYAYQVFPAILTVGVLYFVEKFFTKISPKAIRVFFVPMMCFLIVSPLALLVLGPLGYNIGTLITSVILWVYDTIGWIAVPLLAAILPFMISMGMHPSYTLPGRSKSCSSATSAATSAS